MVRREKIVNKIISLIAQYQENGLGVDSNAFMADFELYGRNGILNSFDLVTLIVDLEEYIQEEFGETVTIADEKVFSLKHSPFRTASALADYTESLIISDE